MPKSLGEFPSPPRREDANEAVQRGQAQIRAIAESISLLHEKVQVIAVINGGDRRLAGKQRFGNSENAVIPAFDFRRDSGTKSLHEINLLHATDALVGIAPGSAGTN